MSEEPVRMTRQDIKSDVPTREDTEEQHREEIKEWARKHVKPVECYDCEQNSDHSNSCLHMSELVDGVKCTEYKRCKVTSAGQVERKESQHEKSVFDADIEQRIQSALNVVLEANNQLTALGPHLNHLAAGEENTKKAISVLCLSGKSPNSEAKQIILLKAEPGSGKSQLMRKLTQGYNVKDVGRFSAHALDYSNLQDFQILRLKELGSMDEEKQGISTIKFLSSDDQGYAVEITSRNEKTKKYETETYRIPPITVISSTTRLQVESQFERRAWLFPMDETSEQTKNIALWKADNEAQNAEKALGFRKITDYEFSSEVYTRFIQSFQFKTVIVPFPRTLLELLGYDVLRVRGDFDKILNFVKLYAQFNLKRLRLIRGDVYALSPEVAIEALKIIIEPLRGMLSNIDKRTSEVFSSLKTIVTVREVHNSDEHAGFIEEKVTYCNIGDKIDKTVREMLAVKLGKSERTIRNFFSQLENSGYVSGDGKKPKTFTLLYDVSNIEKKLSGLLVKAESADNLTCQMEKETQEWCQNILVNLHSVEEIGLDAKTDSQTSEVCVSQKVGFTNPSLECSQPSSDETPSDNRQNQKLPTNQTKHALAKGAVEVLNGYRR